MINRISNRKEIQSYYANDQVSKNYIDRRFQHALGRVLHEKQVGVVNRTIKNYNCRKILELACGPARLTSDIVGGSYCVAVDGNYNMITEGTSYLKARGADKQWFLRVADIFDMELNDKFDLIYAFRFIRHFTLDDRRKLYKKIEQHLVPGGLVIFDAVNRKVSEPVRLKDGLEKYPIYDELYMETDLRGEIARQGWKIIRLVPVHPQYKWLRALQIHLAPLNNKIAYYLMHWIERYFNVHPLEWIVICQYE